MMTLFELNNKNNLFSGFNRILISSWNSFLFCCSQTLTVWGILKLFVIYTCWVMLCYVRL